MIKLGTNSIGKVYLGSTEIAKAYLGSTLVYQKAGEPTPNHACVTFRSDDENTLSMTCNGTAAPVLYYSTNGTTWTLWDYSSISFSVGHPVFIYGNNPSSFSTSDSDYAQFVMGGTGKVSCSGDLTTFIDGVGGDKAIPSTYYFCSLFKECSALKDAPSLPSTTLTAHCYRSLFNRCSGLVNAPVLPSTALQNYCYYYMFYQCTSLVNAPALPATTLKNYCYAYMFKGCSKIVTAPELKATTLVSNCYTQLFANCSKLNYIKALFTTKPTTSYTANWVNGVASSGTFVKNSSATWSVSGNNGVPSNWTIQTAAS